MTDFAADSILVHLDVLPSGELAKSAAGLLGAAASVGTPVALVVAGAERHDELAAAAGALGAQAVLVADLGGADTALTVPHVDALAAAADLVQPDAVLISNSIEGRDIAGRFAARTRRALSADAVGVARDDEGVLAQHSVYGGAYNVTSAPTFGAYVITVRQGAIDAREGVMGLIPGSMGTRSYVTRGKGNADALYSAPHGAGRVMSRRQAKKRFTAADLDRAMKGIVYRPGAEWVDEIPAAYKDIDQVMEDATDLVEVVHELRQVLNVKGT